MPRRPPRKPDPSLDISGHLLDLTALPSPLDPATLFPAAGPIELEVGSGKGLFLSTASTAAPAVNFLGIEISGGYARLCAGKLAARRASNARIIHGDGTRLAIDGLWWEPRVRPGNHLRGLAAAIRSHQGLLGAAAGRMPREIAERSDGRRLFAHLRRLDREAPAPTAPNAG